VVEAGVVEVGRRAGLGPQQPEPDRDRGRDDEVRQDQARLGLVVIDADAGDDGEVDDPFRVVAGIAVELEDDPV
jgi:hypothetical protein